MKRLSLILTLVLLGAAGLAGGASDSETATPAPPEGGEEITVKQGTVELTTHATGTLSPKNRTVVPAPISGKLEWVTDEGTLVRKGAEVARIDCTDQAENLAQAKLELATVEAELRRARFEEQLVREQLEFDVKRRRLELESATLVRSLLGPPTAVAAELSRLTAEQAKFAMDAADKEYNRMKQLGEKGVESARSIATARLKFERAQADCLKAKVDYELLLKGTPAEDIAVADQQVKHAEVALQLAKERLVSQAAYQATQVRVAEVAVERVKDNCEICQGRIDRSRVTAPVDGVVILPRNFGMPLRAGSNVWRSSRLLDVADLTDMTVEAVISQVDWPRVKPGQKVDLRLVAFPDKVFHGTVQTVGKLARDRSLILAEEVANVMSFHVVVDIDGRAEELRPSYSARITIVTDRFEKCIAVPRDAVVRADGRDFVWVKETEHPRRCAVTLGPSDATQVVVEKGLRLGEVVIVPPRMPVENP